MFVAMPTASSNPVSNKRPLFVIFITVFIDLVGFGMIIPLSPFLAQKFGADSFQVGLLMAAYSGFQFLFSPFWGRMSDRIGRRPVLLISLFGSAASHLVFGIAGSLNLLFIARAFAGMFGANISTAMAYIADVTGEKERSKGMGLIGAAFGLGFVCGPALGGIIAIYKPEYVAFVASAICFANFIMAYFVLNESLSPEIRARLKKRASRVASLLRAFRQPILNSLLGVSFLTSFGLSCMEASLFLFVKDIFGWSLQLASFGFAYVGIAMAFNQGFLVRRLLPKYGEPPLLFAGTLLFGLALILTGAASHVWMLGISMTMLALGSGFVNPSVNGSVSLLSDKDQQGEAMGVVQSLSALARILGPPIGGYMYAAYAPSAPFYFGGFTALLAFVVVTVQFRKLPSAAKTGVGPKSRVASKLRGDGTISDRHELQPGELGRYQLQNIASNSLPYVFVNLESSPLVIPSQDGWMFKKLVAISPRELLEKLPDLSADKQYPVLLIDRNGALSQKASRQLTIAGYMNVFIVAGGLEGFVKDLG